jgi:hypothetical protein
LELLSKSFRDRQFLQSWHLKKADGSRHRPFSLIGTKSQINLASRLFFGVRDRCFTFRRRIALTAVFFIAIRFGYAFDRNDLFAVRRVEDRDALGGTSGNTDTVDRYANELSAVRNEQNLVACLDREQGDELADFVGLRRIGSANALAATTGNAELVGRGTFAIAVLG